MSEYTDMILGDDENRRVEGWASVAVLDRQGDIVPIDTIKSAMLKYSSRGGPVLWSHENKIVGKMIQWDVNSDNRVGVPGVHMIVELFKDSKLADDAWKAIKEKRITGFSIGGVANDIGTAKMTGGKEARVLKDIELNEISLVESPANQMALLENVSMAKSMKGMNMLEDVIGKAELTDEEKAQLADKLIEWLHTHHQTKMKEASDMGKSIHKYASTEEMARKIGEEMASKGWDVKIVPDRDAWRVDGFEPKITPPYTNNMQTIKGNGDANEMLARENEDLLDNRKDKEKTAKVGKSKVSFINKPAIEISGAKAMSVRKLRKHDEDEEYDGEEEKAVTRVKADDREDAPVGVLASDDDEDEPAPMKSAEKRKSMKPVRKEPKEEEEDYEDEEKAEDDDDEEEEKGAEYAMSLRRLVKQQDVLAEGLAVLLKEVRLMKATRKAEDEEYESKAHEEPELDEDAHAEVGEESEKSATRKANYKDTSKPVSYPVPSVDGEAGKTPQVQQATNPTQDAMVKRFDSKVVMKGANGSDSKPKMNAIEQILLGKAKAHRGMQ